jgi:hypothetical protein
VTQRRNSQRPPITVLGNLINTTGDITLLALLAYHTVKFSKITFICISFNIPADHNGNVKQLPLLMHSLDKRKKRLSAESILGFIIV